MAEDLIDYELDGEAPDDIEPIQGEPELYEHFRTVAFSMLQDQQWLFAIITLVVMVGAIWYLHKHMEDSFWMVLGLTLIIAGGLGNFIDRISQGFVVDMFHVDFINFAIFNVAATEWQGLPRIVGPAQSSPHC